jgi:hypothetical protein
MPIRAKIDRSTLRYSTSYHRRYVIVNATFEAAMVSGQRGQYRAVVFLSPSTGELLLDQPCSVMVLKAGGSWAAHATGYRNRKMDRSFAFLEELSRVVIASPVWTKHKQQGPDPKLTIMHDGTEIREGTQAYQNYIKSDLWRARAQR